MKSTSTTPNAPEDGHSRPEILTVLEPCLRTRIEIGSQGVFAARHATSVEEAMRLAKEGAYDMLLLSPAVAEGHVLAQLAHVAHQAFPMEIIAVYGERQARPSTLLALGAHGVRTACDLTTREGWGRLRELTSDSFSSQRKRIWTALNGSTSGLSDAARVFLQHVVAVAPRTVTVRQLSVQLGVPPSTLLSHFFRARLPSPKQYLAKTRLLFAAALFESKAVSAAWVAHQLNYSSAQSFGRHVRTMLGMTAGELKAIPFERIAAHYQHELVRPLAERFQAFESHGHQRVQ